MARPREAGSTVRRIRKRLWLKQNKRCHWCDREIILPEDLLGEYVPLHDIYDLRLADQLGDLHSQLMNKLPEYKARWLSDVATVDHVIEHARGGSYDEENLVVACISCNAERGRDFESLLESGEAERLGSADAAKKTTLKGASGPGLPLD